MHTELAVELATKIAHLSKPENYPEPTTSVRRIDTHMSCVFVTDHYVYKMKRPIKLPFLDFRKLEDRRFFCEESLRLNRRLAPHVYIGVVPLTLESPDTLQLGGGGRPVEWLEKMIRLPHALMLDQCIASHRVTAEDVIRSTKILLAFYTDATPVDITPAKYRERFVQDIKLNHRELADPAFGLDAGEVESITDMQLSFAQASPCALEHRAAENRIIEAHGDLRPEHVCLTDPPAIIDALEFDRDLRLLDPADELAFLAMECEFAGAEFIGPILFASYEQYCGDAVADNLKHFYMSHRACIRARLAAWHVKDHPRTEHPRWLGKATRYLQLATLHSRRIL
jgi:uncharacterized protein